MGKILLVGGPARVGKSTLVKNMRFEVNGQIVAGDAFSHGVRESVTVEQFPDLFVKEVDKPELTDPHDQHVDRLRRRDQAMWPFYKNYIQAVAHESDDDLLMDGNFWPDYLAELEIGHRAVFLVDTSPDRASTLKRIRDDETATNNWMRERSYTDEKIELWAQMDKVRSRKIIKLCELYDYTYFDLAIHGMSRAQELAKEYLLQS